MSPRVNIQGANLLVHALEAGDSKQDVAIVEHLRNMSGKAFGNNAKAWRKWLDDFQNR